MKKPRQFRIEESLLLRFDRVNDALAANGSEVVRRLMEEYTLQKEKELNIMAKVIEVIERKENFPLDGEAYVVGRADDGRYFFAWGPEYPYEKEIPAYDVPDGKSGVSFHETKEEALKAMREAIEARDIEIRPTPDMVIRALKEWGWNAGEFEEIVVKLAQREDTCIRHAEARVYNGTIIYELTLTKDGVELYEEWCRENGFSSGLRRNVLEFEDQDEESVRNTLKEWRNLTYRS